ncbi:MAG TPA: response regulator [Bryobacteraceae bacterium]|nr:response regulator [Bryobacteraceae bacterium]
MTSQAPLSVFLVEDNPADVVLVRMALARTGRQFALDHAANGEIALRFAEEYQAGSHKLPDVVLLDLNLPRINGLQVLKALRGLPALQKVPIMILSSSGTLLERKSAEDLGANRYLSKPNTLDEFLTTVGTACLELTAASC